MSLLIKAGDATLVNQELIKDGDTGAWLDSDSLHDIKALIAALHGNVGTIAQLDRDTQSGPYTLTDAWQTVFEVLAIDAPQIIEMIYVGLENMAAGDQVELRVQNIKESGGAYDNDKTILFYESYLDARPANEKRIAIGRVINQYGCKLEARQPLHPVSYKNIDIEVFQSGRIELGGGGGSGSWITSKDLPVARASFAICSPEIGGKGYAIGGAVAGGVTTNRNEYFDPLIGGWIGRTNMTTGRYYPAVAAVSNVIYVLGGSDGTLKNESYDPGTNAWTTNADLPEACSQPTCAVDAIGGLIYFSQGVANQHFYYYDPVNNNYTPRTDSTFIHQYAVSGVVSDIFYALQANSEKYDPVTNAWTGLANPAVGARHSVTSGAVVNGIIYSMGGTVNGVLNSPRVDAYNPTLNTWAQRASLPTGRRDLSAFLISGKVYAFGGVNAAGYLKVNERYTPPE